MKRCSKGKSCGATCIARPDGCVVDLAPNLSQGLNEVRSRAGVVQLYYQVRDQKIKGGQAKFEKIRKQLADEVGGRINKTDDLVELKKRLQAENLIPKTKKTEKFDVAGIFKKPKEDAEQAPSLPKDLRKQLFALNKPATGKPDPLYGAWDKDLLEKQIKFVKENRDKVGKTVADEQAARMERELKRREQEPAPGAKKGKTELVMDDISRILRGEAPLNMEVAEAPGKAGIKVRTIQEGDLSAPAGSATGNTRWARKDAEDFDDVLRPGRREGDPDYNGWSDSYGSGTRKIGEGSFGTVLGHPDGTFVKRGDISDSEAKILDLVGKQDLGPRLIAADINGPGEYLQDSVSIRNGRIAMTQVEGSPMGQIARADTKFGGKNAADVYWKALADLHRLGIAHNDAHIDNILVDENGKGRWVDFGLAQASPKAALAEAMGVFNTIPGSEATRGQGAAGQGNWQSRQWEGTGVDRASRARRGGKDAWKEFEENFPIVSRVWDNRADAQFKLLKMGLSKKDLSTIIDHGIRSTPESYTQGPWAKLSDQQALDVLNTLYDGI